jgi:hypothetical protein
VKTRKKTRRAAAKKPQKRPAAKRKARVAASPRGVTPADVRRIDAAVRKFDQAQQTAAARGADLLAVVAALGAAAVEESQAKLAAQLADRELLRDILAMKDAFAVALPGSLPAEFERLRLLPDALVQWLSDALALAPSAEQGEMEVPAAKLARFECDFQSPEDANQLVRVRVASRGWNRNGSCVVPGRLSLASAGGTAPDNARSEAI